MPTPTIIAVPRAVPVFEIGAGDSRSAVGLGQWQPAGGNAANTRWQPDPPTTPTSPTSTWNGQEPYWFDVSCYAHEADLFTGHERTGDQWDVGTATIILNNDDGWADYPPTTAATTLTVRPGRQVRVGVRIDGAVTPVVLWRGFIDQANPGFEPGVGNMITLECIDGKGEAGRGEVAEVATPVGASETINARIARILAKQNWPTYWQHLEASGVHVAATGFGGAAVDLLNRAADSGGGAVFGDIDGKVRYRNRDWQNYESDEPDDGVIGNYDADWCPMSWELTFSRTDFCNRVIIGRADMTAPIVVDDAVNRDLYGVEPFELLDIETESSTEMGLLANRLLATRGFDTAPRIVAVTLDASTDPNVVDLLADADPRKPSRYVCRHRGSDGRIVFSNRQMFVTGIRHTITPETWEARISLDDAAPWVVGANAGRWETTGRWQVSTWAKAPAP